MEQLSITFQGKDTNIQESVQTAKLALRYLEMQRKEDKFDAFYTNVMEESKNWVTVKAGLWNSGLDGGLDFGLNSRINMP